MILSFKTLIYLGQFKQPVIVYVNEVSDRLTGIYSIWLILIVFNVGDNDFLKFILLKGESGIRRSKTYKNNFLFLFLKLIRLGHK